MGKPKSIDRKIKRGHIQVPKPKFEEYIDGYYTDTILGGINPIWKKRIVFN